MHLIDQVAALRVDGAWWHLLQIPSNLFRHNLPKIVEMGVIWTFMNSLVHIQIGYIQLSELGIYITIHTFKCLLVLDVMLQIKIAGGSRIMGLKPFLLSMKMDILNNQLSVNEKTNKVFITCICASEKWRPFLPTCRICLTEQPFIGKEWMHPSGVKGNGSGCIAGWPATQPPGLHSRLAGYAAYPSAFGCVAWICSCLYIWKYPTR